MESSWSNSVQVSDAGIDVTGIQKPEVGELAGNVPVFAYGGANFIGVYFDNFSWTPTSVENDLTPVAFTLRTKLSEPVQSDYNYSVRNSGKFICITEDL